jgi:hypothetical protein
MPRSFDLSADYPASVERVRSAFADEQYWLARLADSGADDATLDVLRVGTDGTIAVSTTQVLRADRLPGVVTQLHRGDLRIERHETWQPVAAGRAPATLQADIPGAPVKVNGDAVLRRSDADAGSRMEVRVSVEVRIPLVGGKVETFIGGQLVDLLIAEQRFTTGWLGERS